ncbi:antitoxin VapB family protein [Pyrococcus kukulkanii]|uniref:antitoxin VapB family protein n=1 Tax=Pyrococcus kukulkanii TaxID=1609559 RepID=UPI00356377FE
MINKERASGQEKKGNLDVLMIAFGSMSDEEAERFRKTLKEVEEWMNEWTPPKLAEE